jgi:uncharacterized protein (DUF58 family)
MRLTRRGWFMAALALLFYLAANQTQVGWLYVFSALTTGLWLTASLFPAQMLRGLRLTRQITPADQLCAGQTAHITLTLHNTQTFPA